MKISQEDICKNFFDNCFLPFRYNEYTPWIHICMALKNSFESQIAFELFDYISKKSLKYEGKDETYKKFLSFNNKIQISGSPNKNIFV